MDRGSSKIVLGVMKSISWLRACSYSEYSRIWFLLTMTAVQSWQIHPVKSTYLSLAWHFPPSSQKRIVGFESTSFVLLQMLLPIELTSFTLQISVIREQKWEMTTFQTWFHTWVYLYSGCHASWSSLKQAYKHKWVHVHTILGKEKTLKAIVWCSFVARYLKGFRASSWVAGDDADTH